MCVRLLSVTVGRTMTETDGIYRMSAGSFGREIMRRFAPWWVWGGVALAVAGMVTACVLSDVRWAILGFMVLLIMLPMALAICYYNHALCRECFVNVLPHTVGVQDGILVVTLLERQEPEVQEETGEYRCLRNELFGADCVTGWSIRGKAGFVELKDKMRGFLWIPLNIDNFDDIAEFARNSRRKDL